MQERKKERKRIPSGFIGKLTSVVSPTAGQLFDLLKSQFFFLLTTSFCNIIFFPLLLKPDLDCPLIPAVTFTLFSQVVYHHKCFCSAHLFEGGSPTKKPLAFPAGRLPPADVSVSEKKKTHSARKSHWAQVNICAVYLQLPASVRRTAVVFCTQLQTQPPC